MTTLRAHFDGHALIPDEPVELPRDCVLEVQVRRLGEGNGLTSRIGIDEKTGFPFVKVSPQAKVITLEDVRRAEEEF